jgi:hypothetical protein
MWFYLLNGMIIYQENPYLDSSIPFSFFPFPKPNAWGHFFGQNQVFSYTFSIGSYANFPT